MLRPVNLIKINIFMNLVLSIFLYYLWIEMDLVTGEVNDLLQKGKEALISAEKIIREPKAMCHDSLQGPYAIVLSLSDSRKGISTTWKRRDQGMHKSWCKLRRIITKNSTLRLSSFAVIHLIRKVGF